MVECPSQMTQSFVHLHTHSHYSLLDGMGKISDLVKRAADLSMPALAITDHGNLYGAIEFFNEAKGAGIKPIIGLEAYIARGKMTERDSLTGINPYHLTLLAKNFVGYQNLIELTTKAHLEGYYYRPRIDKALLSEKADNLICLSGCLGAEVPQAILSGPIERAEAIANQYLEIFGRENYYLEIQDHPNSDDQKKVNLGLISLSKKLKLKLVATGDVHYLLKEDAEAQDALICVQTGKFMADDNRLKLLEYDISMRSPEEMRQAFRELPEAIENSLEISRSVSIELPLEKMITPRFKTPIGISAFDHLKALCFAAIKDRYPKEQTGGVSKRLNFELQVIEKTGFADYFLIVEDFVRWARNRSIGVGPGRGSAAGSIVSYLLKITSIDPLKYQLLFERFLDPNRLAPPDIDLDFADNRRDEVIEYVMEKYGRDNVAQIITFGTMAARNSIRDTGRVLGLSYQEVDRIAKLIPFNQKLEESLNSSQELKELYRQEPRIKKLIDIAKKLEGVARHASVHAAGVVISPEKLTKFVPLQREAKGNKIITQYSMYDLEKIGLLKMDFLGLTNLTIIDETLKIIEQTEGKKLSIEELPLDDKETFGLLSRAETTGVFQLESEGMKRYLKKLKPSILEDIIAMVALYRPGPMELIPNYIAGKHGKRKITYLHPKLEPILKETYGIAVYQEQVLQIAKEIAGFSYSEADVLRKAIGKKIKGLLLEQREKFVKKAVLNGTEQKIAERLFDFMEPFARYGFNRAHAACYALIAYQTAYLKARHPAAFMAALLTSEKNDIEKIGVALEEARRMKLAIKPPDVNDSAVDFSVDNQGAIRFGLSAIKNVGLSVAEEIVRERKNGIFSSLTEFVSRLSGQIVNRKVLESLAKAGALDQMAERNQILTGLEAILRFSTNLKKASLIPQLGLFNTGSADNQPRYEIDLPSVEPVDLKQRLIWERELLSMYISQHPFSRFQTELKAAGFASLREVKTLTENETVLTAGVLASNQIITTRTNQEMAFARLEDTTASLEIIIFPNLFATKKELLRLDSSLAFFGRVSKKDRRGEAGEEVKLIVEQVAPIETELKGQALIENLKSLARELISGSKKVKGFSAFPPKEKTESFKAFNPKRESPTGNIKEQTQSHEKVLSITLPKSSKQSLMVEIKDLLIRFPGQSKVLVKIADQEKIKVIEAKTTVSPAVILKRRLEEIVGRENVEFV